MTFLCLAAARLARCDRDREIALVAVDVRRRGYQVRLSASRTSLRSLPSRAVPSSTSWCEPTWKQATASDSS